MMTDCSMPLLFSFFFSAFQVMLVGGPNATTGRVEIYYNKTFGTVCNSTFTDKEAAAVCRSAGF